MSQKQLLSTIVIAGALLALPAFGQEGFRSEATAQATGYFVKDTNENGLRQSATNSGGFLASYRFSLNQNHGVEVNYGYALNTQTLGNSGVKSRSHETSAAYVFRYPLRRWTPFALAGVGGLVFDPKDEPQTRALNATTQARAFFVYGGGADFEITKRIFFRAQYRGQVYKSPDFDLPSYNLDRVTHRAVPSAGIGFKF